MLIIALELLAFSGGGGFDKACMSTSCCISGTNFRWAMSTDCFEKFALHASFRFCLIMAIYLTPNWPKLASFIFHF